MGAAPLPPTRSQSKLLHLLHASTICTTSWRLRWVWRNLRGRSPRPPRATPSRRLQRTDGTTTPPRGGHQPDAAAPSGGEAQHVRRPSTLAKSSEAAPHGTPSYSVVAPAGLKLQPHRSAASATGLRHPHGRTAHLLVVGRRLRPPCVVLVPDSLRRPTS